MAEPNGRGRPAPMGRLPWRRTVPAQPTGASTGSAVPGPPPTAEQLVDRDLAAEDLSVPPPPVIEETPPPAFGLEPIRLAALGLALVLVLGLTMVKLFVAGPPSVDELRARAGVDGWTELTVGVKDDQPGVAYQDPSTKIWSGFDVDVAYMIAEDLGFSRNEVKFYGIESEDRARMQATEKVGGQNQRVPVKLVIASYSITADREKMAGVTFSAPYLYTEQSVITRKGHSAVAALSDFKRQKVCTLSTSTSFAAPYNAQATVVTKNQVGECFDLLRKHEVDAVTTDAAILAGYQAKSPNEFEHWDLGLDATEAWGVNVGENHALKTLVDLTLYHSLHDPHDHRWEDAYQRNLQVEVGANGGTPIAVAQQPDVPKPDVRELPWQDTRS